MGYLPQTTNTFPLDGNGNPVAVLYGIIPDANVPGMTDTYYPVSVSALGQLSVSTLGGSNSRILSGNQTVNATWNDPKALTSTSTSCTGVTIQADARNEGSVWVGGSDVNASTYTGRELWPGDSVGFDINNLNVIYIDGMTNARVFYVATA